MLRVPILRAGIPYQSKETVTLRDYATAAPIGVLSQANRGLIARDLGGDLWPQLQERPAVEVPQRFRDAALHFMNSRLPVGTRDQSAEEFVAAVSATTGLPHAMCRQEMRYIAAAMLAMPEVLDGLTGGQGVSSLDLPNHYAPRTRWFGAVLPASVPAAHALWLPALALRMPVAIRPGRREPWTALRILESLRAAGFSSQGLGFYPSGHDGTEVILRACEASMLVGGGQTVRRWRGDPKITLHGPGCSKIVFGPDCAAVREDHVELIVASVAAHGGRSCSNASSVRTASHGRHLAEALAERLSQIAPRPREDPRAALAAFPDPEQAWQINAAIERGLAQGGAEDVTAWYRGSRRAVRFEGGQYLLPTVIHCRTSEHPLASQEFPFPFVSVVEVPADALGATLGPSHVVTAITEDPRLLRAVQGRPEIGRLNLGPLPTPTAAWDPSHAENLFGQLYRPLAAEIATGRC